MTETPNISDPDSGSVGSDHTTRPKANGGVSPPDKRRSFRTEAGERSDHIQRATLTDVMAS